MLTARQIIELIGSDKMQAEHGVGYKSISKCAVDGEFPASWLPLTKLLLTEHDVVLTEHDEFRLFNVKHPVGGIDALKEAAA